MSLEVIVAIIGGGAALLGTLLGAGASLLGGHLQHRRQVRRQDEQERRAREVAAADRCGELFRELYRSALKKDLFLYFVASSQEARAARDTYREAQLAIAQLPADLASRVNAALIYLVHARDLGKVDENEPHVSPIHEFDYAPANQIIQEIADEVTRLFVRVHQGDTISLNLLTSLSSLRVHGGIWKIYWRTGTRSSAKIMTMLARPS